MSSPIDKGAGIAHAARGRRRQWLWVAGMCAAHLVLAACSGHEGVLLATVSDPAPKPQDSGTCSPRSIPAHDMGLDLFFILDHSHELTPQQWRWLRPGLQGLPSVPDFSGIGIGVTTYPHQVPVPQACVDSCAAVCGSGCTPLCDSCLDDCGCEWQNPASSGTCECVDWPDSCSENDYSPTLEITRLSEAKISEVLETLGDPAGAVMLAPALVGSLDYRRDWEPTHSGRQITLVIVPGNLDNLEDDCPDDSVFDLERLLSGPGKPPTYVVAIDDPDNDYDRLAAAGGTTAAHDFTTGRMSNLQFVDFVKRIRAEQGRCEYLLPPPSDFDRTKVNLASATDGRLFPRVQSVWDCQRNPQGWYYDDPVQPTRVMACEGACETLRTETASLQLNCPTIAAPDAGR